MLKTVVSHVEFLFRRGTQLLVSVNLTESCTSLIGHSPAYISDLLTSAADVPGRPALRTASRGDFIVPRTNRKFGDRAFCVAAPRVWNRLPADLRQLRSTQTFRRHLETFLFASCFLLSSDKQIFMDYVMRRRSTVGGALEMFSLPLPLLD